MSSLVGSTLDGRYRIEALLGEGAVGAVYRVVEISTGRVRALKQWTASALDAEIRGRFLRETSALDTFDHPNIVKVLGYGLVDNVPYMVLDYLEGQTLERLLQERGALPVPLALDIARQALSAIAYAHAHHIVHRDLKPENIYLATRPDKGFRVKVLDYGLAKFMAPTGDPKRDKTLTSIGSVIGTPLYMPPEQAAAVSVDLPVDVYAMGCVLYEMLTGRVPFDGETRQELVTAHMRDPVPRLAHVRDELRLLPALQAIIDRALAKKQTERYPNAGAMLADLERIGSKPSATAADRAEQVEGRLLRARGPRPSMQWMVAVGVGVLSVLALVCGLLY
jgi:serine/threonine protein kinase